METYSKERRCVCQDLYKTSDSVKMFVSQTLLAAVARYQTVHFTVQREQTHVEQE